MLASNYSENLNINLNNKLVNNNNRNTDSKVSAFTPTVSSTTSSSLDYLYQAITLIEETKNSNNANSSVSLSNMSQTNDAAQTTSTTATSMMMTAKKSHESDSLNNKFNNVPQFINKINGCTNPCCNCKNVDNNTQNKSKTRKRTLDSDTGGTIKLGKLQQQGNKSDKQTTSKYKKIKTYDTNFSDLNNNFINRKPHSSGMTNRLEKAKHLSRKTELRLNIDPLTPISSSSLSPQSVKSVISPSDSPFISSQTNSQASSTAQTAFNYYPIELISNLLPFYFTPFSGQQTQTTNVAPVPPSPLHTIPNVQPTQSVAAAPQPPPQTSLINNDQNYFQNLINTIYSLANYQQLQQFQSSLLNPLNSNNLILYSIQQQLQQQQQQRTLNISNHIQSVQKQPLPQLQTQVQPQHQQQLQKQQPQLSQPVIKKSSEPIVKSKLISYINESEIEIKVNEHFRRSLGSKFLKISHKLNKSLKPKKRTHSESTTCDTTNSNLTTNTTNRLDDTDAANESSINYDDLNYDVDDEETFIEYSNDEQTSQQPLSPVTTVSASDSYSRASINDDDLIQNEDILDDDENSLITSAATNNSLLYSPVSTNSIAEVNY